MKYILAIDQGTTGSRAVVYDKSAKVIASAYQEFRQYFPKPGWVEHNPEEIWHSVNSSLQRVLKKVPVRSIAAIGITNQRETTIIWDKETGKPIHNAIVWQCRRTAERCNQLKKIKAEAEFFRKRTGLPIDAYFSATKIEWLLQNVRGALAKAKSEKLLFGTTDTWILWKLTSGKAHATDYTNASRTMLFNIEKLQWDEDILKKFKIPRALLPRVRNSSGAFGETIKIGDLAAGIPITGIAGDQQAALFGQTCFEPGTIKNTYGTGCFILLNTGKKRVSSKYGLITTLGCGIKGAPIYVLEGAVFIAGAAIQWLRDGLKLLAKASESEKMAIAAKDNAGVYFVPAFVGLGAPYWDPDARGAIFGITRGTTKNHLARAALEAMCYQAKDVLAAMEKDTGLKIKDLKVDGGASANNFLCQFQADILGINVIRPKVIETTSLGAAYLAGLAVGYWKDTDEIRECWSIGRKFLPRMPKSKSAALYAGWTKAVKRTFESI
ncbi:MAG: glycerol kinase [Omnitrophica WOR_2 bacterium GWF2_43_52]|nr:MAG: glycerol kinase [Omnitrophica WOR_2 bacterium GWF2_43_52]OGX53216.1 MAG: glycerol kinase [Omnitrophica WOR_2 bacterium RIFOXYC2_FULL_43_9]HAH19508.1 glycerol kinase [Candidatus Omnitrophota bacterium]HBG64345.1 glycerol kinase [Candidatus Omnitrophota bacterium]HCD38370.1 glycerol kinase [Candidatus Omnitrophota bacterium]